MARQTLVRAMMPSEDDRGAVGEIWSILTHPMGTEWWSEVLDENRHPCVDHDQYGYDTVRKFYGDTVEESRRSALKVLTELIHERGGRVETVGEMQDL